MEISLIPSELKGSVKAIASKSYAHRLLICSALSDRKTFVECSESSEDIKATKDCLNALGAKIESVAGGYKVTPLSEAKLNKNAVLNCGESGSTYRFMLPVACALGSEASFELSGRLPKRPISDLTAVLEAHGCNFSGIGESSIKSCGKLRNGIFYLPGNVSSQYISGLLFALPLLSGERIIELTTEIESKDYISMTISALKIFGVDVKHNERRYILEEDSKYSSPERVTVEGDWSNAAFWLCAGAIGDHPIECIGLNPASLQGDRAVADILKKFGAEVLITDSSYKVKRGAINATEIDAEDVPDIIPVLAVVASVAEGRTCIKNAGRLRIKESDRLNTVSQTLKTLGADITETDDGLIIKGRKKLQGGIVDSFGDHRIAMMAAIASTVCENPVTIKNAEAVNKSYPGFFEDYTALSGKILKGGV